MKSRSLLLVTAIAGSLAASGTSASSVQAAPATTSTATTASRDHSTHGDYRASDGTEGTFVETFTKVDAVTTDTIVYTPTDSTATITDTLTTTSNTNGTRTVVFTHLALGATVPFSSTVTLTASTKGGSVGTGTYTAADGTTGTLATLVYKNGDSFVTSTDLTSAAGALTRELTIEERGNGGDSEKTLTVVPAGTLTVATIVRFGGMHHHHF